MNDRTYLEDKLERILSRRHQFTEHQLRLLVTGIEISLLGAEGEHVALGLLDSYRKTIAGWIDIKKRDGTVVTIDGTEYTMHRDPRETDEEYQERKQMVVDLEKAGGRMVIATEDLSEYEIKMIEKAADEYPEEELDLHGGLNDQYEPLSDEMVAEFKRIADESRKRPTEFIGYTDDDEQDEE